MLKKLLKNLKKISWVLTFTPDLRNSSDKGEPLTHSKPDHEVSKIFLKIAEKIKLYFQ